MPDMPPDMIGIPIPACSLSDLVGRYGGVLRNDGGGMVRRVAPVEHAGAGDLAPLFAARHMSDARVALERGALLLIAEDLKARSEIAHAPGWLHSHAAWVLAELLDLAEAKETSPIFGEGCCVAPNAIVLPRVRVGARVRIGPGAVIGAPGFGFVTSPHGVVREIPQLGGVLVEDDVHIGPLSTIASGTLGPTVLRRGVKLDAQVHVGHNCEIGEETIIAAQVGIAGSVSMGRGVLVGGQAGIADHLRIGDGARIAAKSGVIGDVPAGATVAGYPAAPRSRWLRGIAETYRLAARRSSSSDKGREAVIGRNEPSNEGMA